MASYHTSKEIQSPFRGLKAQQGLPQFTSLIKSPVILLFTYLTPAALEDTKFILKLGFLNFQSLSLENVSSRYSPTLLP